MQTDVALLQCTRPRFVQQVTGCLRQPGQLWQPFLSSKSFYGASLQQLSHLLTRILLPLPIGKL